MRVLFLRTKTLICCNKRNHEFIFYTLRKTVKIRRRRLTDSVVMTSWLWAGIHRGEKPVEKHKEGFCLATKIRISFRDFQSFTGFFQKWRSLWGLFICCTEDHTCTVVNNGTCAVLSAHTANWRQKSFIQVFFVSASVLSMGRCYKLFLPQDAL